MIYENKRINEPALVNDVDNYLQTGFINSAINKY